MASLMLKNGQPADAVMTVESGREILNNLMLELRNERPESQKINSSLLDNVDRITE
jgi:hypothetical protein